MKSEYVYRFVRSSWGIYVGLTAEMIPRADYSGKSIEVVPNIYLSIEAPNIVSTEHDYLIRGIKLTQHELQKQLKEQLPIVIRIMELEIALTDYQPEGLTYALVGWLEQEIGIIYHLPTPVFDKERNIYVFNFAKPITSDE